MTVNDVVRFFSGFAPLELAEPWDNVGLIVGDPTRQVDRILTCLTLTPDVAEEAIREQAQLVVTHHPLLFKPIQRLTTEDPEAAMLIELISAGVGVFSPHTAFDSAREGINADLARRFGLHSVHPLRPCGSDSTVGGARFGQLPSPLPLEKLLDVVRAELSVPHLQYVGDLERAVSILAVACGAAGDFLDDARRQGCDAFLTGETRFHTCLEARTRGIALILPGHYATERPAVEMLAQRLAAEFPTAAVWASRVETDPFHWS